VSELQTKLASKEILISELNAQIENLKDESSAEATKHKHKIKDLEAKISDLDEDLKSSKETITHLKKEKETFMHKVSELETKISGLTKDKSDSQSQHESSKSELERLRAQLEECNVEKKANRETIARMTSERNQIETNLNRTIAEMNNIKTVIVYFNL